MEKSAHYVLLEHISSGTGVVSSAVVGDYEVGSTKVEFQEGDVLYGKLRPNLREVCVASGFGYCSSDILPLRPWDDFSSYYLAAILRSRRFGAQVQRLVGGANLPRIGLRDLMKLEVPWPDDGDRSRLNEMARQALLLRDDISALVLAVDDFEEVLWS